MSWPGLNVTPREEELEDAFMLLLREHDGRGGISVGKAAAERPRDDAPLIVVRGLVRRFGDFTAVASTSFEVGKGEIFGLLGPNGAGKTTTFRTLCGLPPATNGHLEIAGMNLRSARESAGPYWLEVAHDRLFRRGFYRAVVGCALGNSTQRINGLHRPRATTGATRLLCFCARWLCCGARGSKASGCCQFDHLGRDLALPGEALFELQGREFAVDVVLCGCHRRHAGFVLSREGFGGSFAELRENILLCETGQKIGGW